MSPSRFDEFAEAFMGFFERIRKKLHGRIRHLSQKHFLLFLSVIVGFLAGIVAVVLKNLVHLIQSLLTSGFAIEYYNVLYVAYPLIGLLITGWIIKKVIRKDPGPGIPSVLHAISKRKSTLKRHNIFSPILTSFVTVGFGGSAGLEGPTVQASAALGSNIGAGFKLNYKARTLLIGCAAAGSLAAIFKAPIAAIVFAIEVIMIDLTTASLVPLLLASISAVLTTHFFLGDDILLHFRLRDTFHFRDIHFFVLLGILTGLFSVYFSKIYLGITRLMDRIKNRSKKAILGGLILGIIIFIFPALYGEGYDIINALLDDNLRKVTENSFFYEHSSSIYMMLLFMACLLILKVFATALTIGSGGIGGIFAPTLFMGATLGFLYTRFFRYFELKELSASNFTLVGMAGLMAGVLHAPLTAIFLIAEITGGYELFIPLMLTAAISYYTARSLNPHTIYTTELASKGELITHDKDAAVLTLMNLENVIESDFTPVDPNINLGDLVKVISRSQRNVFPVVDKNGGLIGIVTLGDIRQIMFDSSLYDEIEVHTIMNAPSEVIEIHDNMDSVMEKFDETGAWHLPVLDGHKYIGFISKSRLFTAYRELLQEFSETH